MGYDIEAFIARTGTFAPLQALSPCITIVPLAQEFEMILNDEFLGEAIEAQTEFAQAQGNIKETYPGFHLSNALVSFGLSLSSQQPIVYVEAEFWGGMGNQHGVLWHEAKVVLLPITNGIESEDYQKQGFEFLKDAPINSVLRVLGVQVEKIDEFASLGLMQERNMSGWFRRFNLHPNKDDCKAKR
jgi:hypothetical protein